MMTRMEALAHHEAAHAVTASAVGLAVTSVTIGPSGGLATVAYYPPLSSVEQLRLFIAAGVAWNNLHRLGPLVSARDDLANLREMTDDAAIPALLRRVETQYLRPMETTIRRVAAALFARGRLSGDEVHDIIWSAA